MIITGVVFGSVEQCKRIKKLGFNWYTHYFYENDVLKCNNLDNYNEKFNNFDNIVAAPVQSTVVKFIKDVLGYEIFIIPVGSKYVYYIKECETGFTICYAEDWQKSYEYSLSKGIDKALDIIEEEKNKQ